MWPIILFHYYCAGLIQSQDSEWCPWNGTFWRPRWAKADLNLCPGPSGSENRTSLTIKQWKQKSCGNTSDNVYHILRYKQIDSLLDVLRQVIHSYQGETKMYSYHKYKFWFTNLIHIPPLKIWRNLEKMKLNEPGRQKLGRHRSSESNHHSSQRYILTYVKSQLPIYPSLHSIVSR